MTQMWKNDAAPNSMPHSIPGPTSPQSSLIASGQSYVLFPTFTLESGVILHNVPLAYKTWGKLDPVKKDNALIVCHALSGSADVEDWWGPLLGPGKLFDPTRFFIVCANVLGSPYGSAGPCTKKHGENVEIAKMKRQRSESWDGRGWWGPEFPATTVRDDVRITKQLLDFLGVEQIAAVIGGSMGGMSVLEWGLHFPVRFPKTTPCNADSSRPSLPQKPYVRAIVPIATAARHSAWCISWAEAQRQSIYSDPSYNHGYYDPNNAPKAGLSAARMAALLTYRSRDSFESRFGRRVGGAKRGGGANYNKFSSTNGSPQRASVTEEAAYLHNEGNQSPRIAPEGQTISTVVEHDGEPPPLPPAAQDTNDNEEEGTKGTGISKVFSAQSYLRYQGEKFVKRFDANCYVHLTRKMDTHDVARGRVKWGLSQLKSSCQDVATPIDELDFEKQRAAQPASEHGEEVAVGERRLPKEGKEDDEALERVMDLLSADKYRLGAPSPKVLIVSIESDGLFAPPEQQLIHELIGGSELVTIRSPDGHDGFLLEFEQINKHVEGFLRHALREGPEGANIWEGENGVGYEEWKDWGAIQEDGTKLGTGGEKVKESVFGEVEDVTRW